jgi:hypothetical protein
MTKRIHLIMPKLNEKMYTFIYRILDDNKVSMTATQHNVLVNLGTCDDCVIKRIYSLIFETVTLPRL